MTTISQPLAPLYVATIAGKKVAFFRPPESPDFPWVSAEGLFAAMGNTPSEIQALIAELEQRALSGVCAFKGGTAISHPHALGMIRASNRQGRTDSTFLSLYLQESSLAMAGLTDGLSVDYQEAFVRGALEKNKAEIPAALGGRTQ